MAFDVKKWLKEDMGFSDQEADETAAKFTGDRVSKLEAGYASAADRATIAANREELAKAQNDLKASSERLNAEIAEWASMTAAEKSQATELRASLEAQQAENLKLRQTVERIAVQAGVDPKTVLTTEVAVKKQDEAPAVDLSKYTPNDHFATVSRYTAELAAAMPFIAEEHKELTGKRLDTRAVLAEITKRAGQKGAVMDPVKVWEEMHGIPAIRDQKAAEARAAEIAAAEARGEERARSSMAVPGAHQTRSARPSPVLSQRNEQGQFAARTSKLSRPVPQTTVNQAAAAFRSGKYAQKVS